MHDPRFAALAGCALAAFSLAAQAQEFTYTRRADGWQRTEPTGRTYAIDATTISARFLAPITDLAGFQAALAARGELEPALAGLTTRRSNRLGVHDLAVPAGTDVLELVAAVRASGLVEFCEEQTLGTWVGTPNDGQFSSQWALRNTGQTGGTSNADINADLAWDIETGDPSVSIAVLDSGTQISHPDLAPNVWVNAGEVPGNGIDDDGDGFVDDVNGWDFENNNANVESGYFHGTFVAGVIAARTNNGTQVAGVAGGFAAPGCTILACGVGEFGPVGSVLDDAILYAADRGARVITMSLTVGSSTAIDAALDYAANTKGVFVDCATGNSGFSVGYPATNPDVYGIGSTNHNDQVSGFSGKGPECFLVAPGENVLSLDLGGGTTTSSGTSFAAPTVAGIAGLLFSYMPTLTADSVASVLKGTAKDLAPVGFDNSAGWGRADAYFALRQLVLGDCDGNGVFDPQEIADGSAPDANQNGVPDVCEGPQNYCAAQANSTGLSASMSSTGSTSLAANDLGLVATSCPSSVVGIFLYGPNPGSLPLGDGILCLAQPALRLSLTGTDLSGTAIFAFDNQDLPPISPALTPGSTWNFTFWFRDTAGGPAGFNFADGLSATFGN